MTDFALEIRGDGVAVITWDVRGRSMNVLDVEGFKALDACVRQALADDAVKGIVITSGKESFAGGMDLNVLASIRDTAGADAAPKLFAFIMEGHRILRSIERAGMGPGTNRGGKPVACAIPGPCAGIGTEIALACHRRFMADTPDGCIGLPEVRVGLFPGAGGTTRYSRMVGVTAAAPVLLEGRLLDPGKARAARLVDEVVAPDELLARAREWVLRAEGADLVKPWDRKGCSLPGGDPYDPQGFMAFVGANAIVNGRTRGVYPAARALLSAVYEGALVPFDTALRIEARHFTSMLMNPTSSAMIRSLFISKEALEKGARRPDAGDQKVRKVGVLGAGMMGAGIARVSAMAGIDVVLVDRDLAAAESGKARSKEVLDKGIARGRVAEEDKAEVLGRILATADLDALDGCDLIVEAVFEDPAVKADVTKRVGKIAGDDCILATNTSTLPITGLAQASARPGQFIGIHFFSPVDRMPLVEIIKGAETGDRAVAKALDYVRQLRKTPIVVNDARFFYANRCVIPYVNEGLRMIGEGVAPALVENAAKLLGFPVGPLQLLDETSIDLGVRIAKATRAAMGSAYPDEAVDAVLFWMAGQGRLGRKAGAGFHAYDATGKRTGLWEGLRERFGGERIPPLEEVQDRLMMVQALEAVRALEDGVLSDIREGDVGAVLGWGFAPWSGGPFSWLDMTGARRAAEVCAGLEARFGARFARPSLLAELAKCGEGFYERFGPGRKAA